MTESDQVKILCTEIENVITRHRREFDLTLASYIGVLQVIQMHLFVTETNNDTED